MPKPTEIKLHQNSRLLEVHFEDGFACKLSCEYLRVFSPSAEVKGHGPGQEVLQTEKETVNITSIEQVGNYALQLTFDDGHNTGLYTWNYLYALGKDQSENWAQYLKKLKDVGINRKVS